MRAAFRLDCSQTIGVGHAYRCLTLAKKLENYGINSTFFCRNVTKNIAQKIQRDFQLTELKNIEIKFTAADRYAHWLGCSERHDAVEFLERASDEKIDLVVVDHYGLGFEWESLVRNDYKNLIVIDDLKNRKHICRILIDQSVGLQGFEYTSLVPEYCRTLLGPRYALLGQNFEYYTNKDYQKKFNILLNFGGTDKDNFTGRILKQLQKVKVGQDFSVKIIVGKDYKFLDKLRTLISCSQLRINLIVDASNMAKEISECEFAIGAGGISLLERSVLGVPSILYCIALNQRHICDEYQKKNLGYFLDFNNGSSLSSLENAINSLLQQSTLNEKKTINRAFVDPFGADRVVSVAAVKLGLIRNRMGKLKDAGFVYDCRYLNTPTEFYLNSKVPTFTEHKSWFAQVIKEPRIKHIIYSLGLKNIGYIRLDEEVDYSYISIYLLDRYRGKKLASAILKSFCNQFTDLVLVAIVHRDNHSSLKTFTSCGFSLSSSHNEFIRLSK